MQRFESFHRGDSSRIHERLLGIFSILIIFITSCDANEETRLTCMFGENMNERRQAFKILDEMSVFSERTALKCNWKAEKVWCSVGDGYSYDWKISDTVTVRRVQGSERPACSCFIVDTDKTEYERPCISDVVSDGIIEASSRPTTTNFPRDKPSIVPQENNQTHSGTSQTDDGGESMVFIVLSVSTTLISILTVLVVLVLALKRLRRDASNRASQRGLLQNSHEKTNNNNKTENV